LAANACGTKTGFLPSLYDSGSNSGGTFSCDAAGNVHINSVQGVLVIVGNALRILIAISGALAAAVIIVAAIYYIISNGDAKRIQQAKEILTNAIVGLVLILASYAIVTWIATGF
jgi:hypothetical protein